MSLSNRGFLAAINHLLAPASWARDRLAPHTGRRALLRVEPFELSFMVQPDGFLAATDTVEAPDVTLSIPMSAIPDFADGDSGKAMNAVRIEGNAEFADALGFVFRHLRWDAEEDLSRVTGDILAHRIVLAAKAAKAAQVRAWKAVGGNLVEYFTEEEKLLVTGAALDAHRDELARLRDDLARLDKRIDRSFRHASSVVGAAAPGVVLPPRALAG